MKYIKLMESTEVEGIVQKVMGNQPLSRSINNMLGDVHAALVGSGTKISNEEFKDVMKDIMGKIIDRWEF
jgi:hypothetical protein